LTDIRSNQDNESVNVILKEDGPVKVENPEKGDIFVQQGGKDLVYSGKINEEGTVTFDHFNEKLKNTTLPTSIKSLK